MSKSVETIYEEIAAIWSKSYWWGDRYDYIETLTTIEINRLYSDLCSFKKLHSMWVQNKEYCQIIIQERRTKQLTKLTKKEKHGNTKKSK